MKHPLGFMSVKKKLKDQENFNTGNSAILVFLKIPPSNRCEVMADILGYVDSQSSCRSVAVCRFRLLWCRLEQGIQFILEIAAAPEHTWTSFCTGLHTKL